MHDRTSVKIAMQAPVVSAAANVSALPVKVSAQGVNVHYGDKHALKDVSINILDRSVTSFIGPSGCGKIDLPALHQPDE